jgi:adenine-specific DNA-methyltransferase
LLARELLTDSGSVFVQISDENVHHVRELMDEVFGEENFVSLITVVKTTSATTSLLPGVSDYIIWYSKKKEFIRYNQLFLTKTIDGQGGGSYNKAILEDGTKITLKEAEDRNIDLSHPARRIYRLSDLRSSRPAQKGDLKEFEFQGKIYTPGKGTFKSDLKGLKNLVLANRIEAVGKNLNYIRFINDFPAFPITNNWADVSSSVGAEKLYVVQINPKVVERCLLMTTNPGDLVLDLTCGSGTTAYVAEQWGRRWITCDVSRVPLALARQRLLTATFPWYQLRDGNSPASGFVYQRKQNKKGEEVGGIVPHITLKSIANNESPAEEILVDRPESDNGVMPT